MAISLALLIFSLLRKGINGDSLSTIAYLIGSGLFFYALLYPWGKAGNYFFSCVRYLLYCLFWSGLLVLNLRQGFIYTINGEMMPDIILALQVLPGL